ncbi:MAG: ABC transporter ATP-binding protein, partial [Sphaerochaeta sp.]
MNENPIALRFSDVSFSYPTLQVLSDVSFHFHSGEFIALVGPNGSGKTTLLKLILGLEDAEEGSIELLGHNPKRSRSLIGYVPQHASYDPSFPISVGEVVAMGVVDAKGRKRTKTIQEEVRRALSQVEMEELYDRPYSELSGGQRRRVLVARALVGDPQMLILDEPTANMDAESERRLYATLGNLKGDTTVLIVTHDMRHVSALV